PAWPAAVLHARLVAIATRRRGITCCCRSAAAESRVAAGVPPRSREVLQERRRRRFLRRRLPSPNNGLGTPAQSEPADLQIHTTTLPSVP
ncbi:unnamed protein product, partial [Urochloa humidicola]